VRPRRLDPEPHEKHSDRPPFAGVANWRYVAATGIAFLDFDHTIIYGDIAPKFGNYLIDHRYGQVKATRGRRAAARDQIKFWAKYAPYLISLGLQAGLYRVRALRRSSLVRTSYKAVKGISADEYYGLMEEFVHDCVPDLIYPSIRDAIESHLDAGLKVVIITTGIEELVRLCLPLLPPGIEVIGCILHEKNGKFTGKVSGPLYGADKANIISAFTQAAGVNLANCWAYTDHYSDYHMLEVVGHGVCVNPNKRLTKLAEASGWKIIRPTVL
jgi:HAD superfamily hydrolase (TIGR01490 family)